MSNPTRSPLQRFASVAFSVVVGAAMFAIWVGRADALDSAGSVTVVSATGSPSAGQQLNSGGSATTFNFKLPTDAACTGDGNAGYRVQSFMVAASVDPSTLVYGELGPDP